MDNTQSLFFGAVLGLILGLEIASFLRRRKPGNESQNLIINKLNQIMANEQQFKEALARVEAATTAGGTALTAIAARITGLEDAIKNAGLTPEVEAALLSQLEGVAGNTEALATALTAMGTVSNPVPEPVPDPVPPVEPPVEPTP